MGGNVMDRNLIDFEIVVWPPGHPIGPTYEAKGGVDA